MRKFTLTLAILFAVTLQASVPKTGTLAIPSNTVSAVTIVGIGDAYNYGRDVDAVKITVAGKTDTNIVLIATVGQPIAGVTNTMAAYSFTADGTTLAFPRNIITTNHLERFYTDTVSLSCAFALATNTAVSATLTNAASVSITIKPKSCE